MIGQVISHYRILSELGEGGMGSVYVAEDVHLGRRVAIKFPVAEGDEHHYRARFLREARAASTLNHPNIAAIYDYGETADGRPFIVMELINGQTLSRMIENGQLSLARSVEILQDVAQALSEAHSQGVIHRDIKPSNVIINDRGNVKVLDFGLAKHVNGEAFLHADANASTLFATHTQSGIVVGTPLYLSPEQAMGKSVDGRSDLFAAGTVLYESIAGKPPFTGKGVIEIAAQVIHVDPPPPSTFNRRVPPELDRISLKALAKKPDDRYQTAGELMSDLQKVHTSLIEAGLDQTPTRRYPIQQHGDATVSQHGGATSAMATLSDIFKRPRMSVGLFLLSIAALAAAVWLFTVMIKPRPHVPSAEAKKWYDLGTTALREGTYFKASNLFQQAIAADDNFALAHARLAESWMELDYGEKAKDEIIRAGSLVPDRSILPVVDALYLKATTDTLSKNFGAAVQETTAIMEAVPASEKAYAYLDLGRAYEHAEQVENAIDSYKKASELDPQSAAAFLRLGILYGRKQDQTGAEAAFKRAQDTYRATSNFEGVAEVLYQQGSLYDKLDKVADARTQFEQALEMSRATGNLHQQIKSQLKLSSVLRTEGKTQEAERYATEVVDLARKNGLENLTTSGLIDVGYSYFVRGDFDEAEKYFKQALEYAQLNKGRRSEARALLSLGSLSMQKGKADEAVRYIAQALPFYKEGGYSKETGQALLLLGRANRDKGDYEAAITAFQQQLEFAKQVGDKQQEALSNEGLGLVLGRLERFPEALSYFQNSHELYKSLGNQQATANSAINTASMLWELAAYPNATSILEEVSKSEARQGGSKAMVVSSNAELAEAALSQLNFAEAKTNAKMAIDLAGTGFTKNVIQAKRVLGIANSLSGATREGPPLCQEALVLAEQSRDPWLVSKARLAHAEALLESGDAKNALANAQQAADVFDRIGQMDSSWRAWLIAARASVRAGDRSKAHDYAVRSDNAFKALEQKWGTKAFEDFLTRPDVRSYRRQLDQLLASN
jgi:serine/threonine protein kinase/tetratricopeptide (TPR) repeat protein